MDAGGRDLGREAVGHGAVVVDAQTIPHAVAAGVVGVHLDLLAGVAVADQQGAALDLQDPRGHGGGAEAGTAAAAATAAAIAAEGVPAAPAPAVETPEGEDGEKNDTPEARMTNARSMVADLLGKKKEG